MDPLFFKCFLAALLTAHAASPAQQSVYRTVFVAPIRDWPERSELPEGDHPPHGEGADSPLYLGLGGYDNINITSTASVGVSGSYVSLAPEPWVPNNFPLVTSPQQFIVVSVQPPVIPPVASLGVRPDPKGHVPNLAVRRFTGSSSGRRG